MHPLHLGVLAAGAWSILALCLQLRSVHSFGRRALFSRAAGNPGAGVRYAFTLGMAPKAKESVLHHLPTYLTGLLFHAGLFSAFLLLIASLLRIPAAGRFGLASGALAAAGGIGGISLLVKRLLSPNLRRLSCPDDYISNLLASSFALLSGLGTLLPGLWTATATAAILLLVWLPLGKLRHCLFFFLTRYHFGAFFGRRGTFPPAGDPA